MGPVEGWREPNVPGCPGWVMLRSMGRADGEVAVEGGAENVWEPRLPKLPPRPARASASVVARANAAAIAQATSSGRKRRLSMKFLRWGVSVLSAEISVLSGSK
jgi:hypothetical protein